MYQPLLTYFDSSVGVNPIIEKLLTTWRRSRSLGLPSTRRQTDSVFLNRFHKGDESCEKRPKFLVQWEQ
jgi:hypothetical protein